MKEKKYYSRLNITTTAYTIYSLLNDITNCEANGLDISPDYQRGYIWSNEYKDKLLLSLILNYPIGNIVINQLTTPNKKNAKQELVDGKQRLTTIKNFVEGNYKVSSVEVDEIKGTIREILNGTDPTAINKMMKKKSLTYADLPKVIQTNILAYNVPLYTIQSANTIQIREYFKVLQNQEKLRAGEIINSMPDNILEGYFSEIGNEFLEKITYTNLNRSEFEKIYYSVIGMVLSKIPMNCPDKVIVRFVEKLESLLDTEKNIINEFNENLRYIKNMDENLSTKGMNKRTLKMILCLAILFPKFYQYDTQDKLKYVMKLSNKLAAFNSSSSDNDSFKKYFGSEFEDNKQEFLDNKAEKYRRIYEVSNRSVKYDSVKEAMEELKELYNNKNN